MVKEKVLVLFGGMSTEHDVSRISACSVLKNINTEKYDVGVIGIDKDGSFLEYIGNYDVIEKENWKDYTNPIADVISYIKGFDVAFPILHGLYGEDGTIQGMFEMLNMPYVGCKVLASSVAMDKVYTKIVLDKAGIKQVPSVYLKVKDNNIILVEDNFDEIADMSEVLKHIEAKLNYPMFVKASNSGSSVGVYKVKCKEELIQGIELAKQYDSKILVETGINAREIECAILEDGKAVKASILGEILPSGEFYSYESKYVDENSSAIIPADLDEKTTEFIQQTAIKAFKAIDGKGLSRVDFFVDKDTNAIYLNEINTLPGFTSISMYPKLWIKTGVEYTKLIDKLIENAK